MFYGLNVQFLLYSYQSRYYSLVLFGTALCILAVLVTEEKIEHNKRLGWHNYLFIAVAITFSFHSSRISGFTIATAIVLYLLYRYKRSAIKLIFSVVFGTMTWVIWYFINSVLLGAPSFGTGAIETHIFTKILMILWKVQVYFFPLISLVIIYLLFELFSKKGSEKNKVEPWFILFSLIILMNIIYVAIPHWGIVNHYFVSILVVAPFFLTAFIKYCFSQSKCFACCLAAILLFSNILNVWPYFLIKKNNFIENNEMNNLLSENSSLTTNLGLISSPNTDGNFRIQSLNDYLNNVKIRSYLWEYLYECNNDVESYVDEVIQILNENSKPGDTVLVLGFEYEPIIFYTNLRVVNNMTTRLKPWQDFFSEYPNQNKYEHLTIVDDEKIDWIIYKNDETEALMFNEKDYLKNNASKFQVYLTNGVNVPLSNSADLDYHFFSELTSDDNVIVYKRIR